VKASPSIRRLAVLLAGALLLVGCGDAGRAGSGHEHAAGSPGPVASVSGPTGMYKGINLPRPYPRPGFTLTDTAGAPFDFAAATAGRPTLLYFGYTHCPDECPTTMADVAVALRTVDRGLAERVRVVFVTTDPARDTPAVLAEWLGRFDRGLPGRFVGLTGNQAGIDAAQRAAGVPLAEDGGQTHSTLLLLYGADDAAHVAYDSANGPRDITHDLPLVAPAP
jgi:protein SCO1/2